MRYVTFLLSAFLLLTLTHSIAVAKTSAKTISGRWCKEGETLFLSPTQWKSVARGGGPTITAKIQQIVYLDDTVQIFLFYRGSVKRYDFTNFNGGTMMQVSPSINYRYQRC